jgi:hypothetical protein
MEIILSIVTFIGYMIIGMVVIYFISGNDDRAYSNAFAGLMAISLWPFLLIYKIYTKFKQLFITLTNLKLKSK